MNRVAREWVSAACQPAAALIISADKTLGVTASRSRSMSNVGMTFQKSVEQLRNFLVILNRFLTETSKYDGLAASVIIEVWLHEHSRLFYLFQTDIE